MASETYTLIYDASSAVAAKAQIDALITSNLALEVVLDRVGPKLKTFAKGTSASVNAFAKAVKTLAPLVAQLDPKLNAVAAAFRRAGSAGQYAATGVKAAGAASTTAAASFGKAATNGTRAASGIKGMGTAAAGATPQLNAAAAAAGQLKANVGQLGGAAKSAGSAMGGFMTRVLALQAARSAFNAILDASKEIEEHWEKMAEEASAFRESLRELASLKGEPGPTPKVTADVLDLALSAAISPEKASAFAAAYENIGPTVREKGHYKPTVGTPDQLEKDVVAEAARTAKRLGVDEEAAGQAIGMVGMFHPITTTGDAMEQLGGALKGLSEGNVKYKLGVKALTGVAAKLVEPDQAEGAIAGKIGSFAEAGVYMGAMSLTTDTAAKAAQKTIQASRLLNPDAANEVGRAALAAAGVTPDMSDARKLIQLNKFMKAEKIADPGAWLTEHKLGKRIEGREAVVGGMKVADVLEKRLDALAVSQKTGATGAATIAANRAFMASDIAGQAAAVDAVKAAVDITEGIEGPEIFEKAKQAAAERRRMMFPNEPTQIGETIMMGKWSPLNAITALTSGVGAAGARAEVDPITGAIPQLQREAARVGVDISQYAAGLASGTYKTRADAFAAAARDVRNAGGDVMGLGALTAGARKRVAATRGPAPAQRPAGGPLGGGKPIPGAGAAGAGVGAGASLDLRRLEGYNADQLRVLASIDRNTRAGGGRTNGLGGALPLDGGGFGPMRA